MKITEYFIYKPWFNGVVSSRDSLPRVKDCVNAMNCNNKQSKEHIGFYSISTKIPLCTLILLELNIFCKMYLTKSKTNQSLTIYVKYKKMILSFVEFIISLS